jgi:class 3 adenylate cyclase/predicted ATPase
MSDLSAWLDSLGLGKYATIFAENAVDLDVLPDLNETDLERLGVALGHRKRILKAAAALSTSLRENSTTAMASAEEGAAGERRHLTVLFCDMVGSTELAVQLDPEELSGIVRRFQATCTSIITQNGGYIARFMGDGLLAYFGYPRAHEDDAERAARAGLDLVAKIGQLLLPSGAALQVRVGIATGLVVIDALSSKTAQEQAVVGEAPNLAARLQSLASPNSVMIGESTKDLLGAGFVSKQAGPFVVKGFSQPITAFRITGEQALESRFDAKRSRRFMQLVGRQDELRQMLDSWSRAVAGEGQVLLLCGEPGIGKSRLSMALFDHIKEPHIRLRYQCSPHHTRSPLYPVIMQLTSAARFQPADGPQVKLEKLEAMLAQAGQGSLANAELFAALLSIPTSGRYPEVDLTPTRRKDLTISALIKQLVDLAAKAPILCVFEDVHWIDPTTLELLNKAIDRIKAAQVLFLITFRPEFFPPWLDRPFVKMLRLDRLGRGQVETMIANITGRKELPDEIFEQIVSKTDGVPLFVEELTNTVLESGLLLDAGDRYVSQSPSLVLSIPVTLHDSLMARLDRLAQIKEVAQIGAALGREFPYRLLAAVATTTGTSLQSALAQFGSVDLILSRGEPPDATYIFKHALIQDAAYSSLTRIMRRQLHGRIANALTAYFPDMVETQPELMAHHLEQAGSIEPAIDYLRIAGQRAIERSANAEAIGHLEHARVLAQSIPADERQTAIRLGLEVILAQATIAARGYAAPETRETLLRARALLDYSTEPSQKFGVLYGLWACYYVGGDVVPQQKAATEFMAEAERHGDTAMLGLSNRTLGSTLISLGRFDAARQHLERARELYNPEHHASLRYQYGQDIGATALCYLSWTLWHLGYVDQASKTATQAVKHAEGLNHPFTLAYTIAHARGMLDVFGRRPQEARSYAARVLELCNEHRFPFWAAGGQILDGWATACLGEPEKGLQQLRAGLAAWRMTGARLWLPIFIALEAEAQAKAGHPEAALQAIEQAIATSKETGEQWAVAEILRIKAHLLSQTRHAKAGGIEALLLDSIEIARRQQARCWELRTACDLARLWQQAGRNSEAINLLHSIYDQFTEGFDTADLQDARGLMDSLASSVAHPAQSRRERKAQPGKGRGRS